MKKIIFLLMFVGFLGFSLEAQTNFSGTTSNAGTSTANAITGTSFSYTTIEVPVDSAEVDTLNLSLSGNYNSLIKIQCRVLKGTGTIAGSVRLYGSMYGTTGTWDAIGDTLTLANNAVNEIVWNLTSNDTGWKYLRILQDGGTTMTGTISARALGIKP